MKYVLVLFCWPGTQEAVCKENHPKPWGEAELCPLTRQTPHGQWLKRKVKAAGEIARDDASTGKQSHRVY